MRNVVPLLVATAALCSAQSRTTVSETLGFENSRPDSCPPGWACSSGVVADSEVAHSGKWSVRIARDADSEQPFWTVTKMLPVNFAGQRIELRGYIRTEDVKDFCGFWMREDGDGGPVAFTSMQQTNPAKGTTPWTEYSISLPLRAEAKKLFFGFLVSGEGKGWADDLQLLVDGKAIDDVPRIAPQPTVLDRDHEFDAGSRIAIGKLTGLQIENLALLCKVWGFLKYYDARVTTGMRHFDYDLFRVMPAVLKAATPAGADRAMLNWIDGLGETRLCPGCAKLDETDIALVPDLAWIADTKMLGAELSSRLEQIRDARPVSRGGQFYVSMTPGVGSPSFDHELNYSGVHLPDAGYQLLALFRLWNCVRYWYPDRDVIGEDWDAVLRQFIPVLATAPSVEEYKRDMMRLIARIHDTHANLWGSLDVRPPSGPCRVPVKIRFVENVAVVSGYLDDERGKATGLKPGDVIEQIGGFPVADLVKQWTPMYADSNDAARLRDIAQSLTLGGCDKPFEARVRREQAAIEIRAGRIPSAGLLKRDSFYHDRPGQAFQMLSPDVAYLKISEAKMADARKYVERAAGTKGWIIDLRNYPDEFMVFALGQYLVNKPTDFVTFTHGDLSNPGAFHWGPTLKLEPKSPHYAGKICILVDEVTQSSAEYTAMAFRVAPGAEVIGSTTAGADGNTAPIPLPGGLRTMFSGLGVFYPGKKPTQRVGIVPDVLAQPTIEGIREGRDEVLETAIRRITSPKGTN